MSNFQESGINFKFQSPKWNVVKYDEHLAHKKVSNALQPTKAVDFLGIHEGIHTMQRLRKCFRQKARN